MNFLVISHRYNFGPASIVFHSPNLQIGHMWGYQQETKKNIFPAVTFIDYNKQKREDYLRSPYKSWSVFNSFHFLFSALMADEADEAEKDTAI